MDDLSCTRPVVLTNRTNLLSSRDKSLPYLAICPKLCHSLNLISGSRWPKAVAKSCGGHIQSIPHVIQAVANLSRWPKAVAKSCGGHIQSIPHVIQAVANLSSCGGHIQSIPHVIQAVANLSSYSLGSQSASILYGDSSPQLLLDSGIKWGTVLGIWQPYPLSPPTSLSG